MEYAIICENLGRVLKSRNVLGKTLEVEALDGLNLEIEKALFIAFGQTG